MGIDYQIKKKSQLVVFVKKNVEGRIRDLVHVSQQWRASCTSTTTTPLNSLTQGSPLVESDNVFLILVESNSLTVALNELIQDSCACQQKRVYHSHPKCNDAPTDLPFDSYTDLPNDISGTGSVNNLKATRANNRNGLVEHCHSNPNWSQS